MTARNRRVIDTGAIRHNTAVIRAALPESTKMLAVVKADGYGHGGVNAALAALAGGAEMLAVATVEEGLALRKAGIGVPVLVLGAAGAEDAAQAVSSGLTQTVCSPEMIRICGEAAARTGREAAVHLKVDSGMGRLGVRTAGERDAVLEALRGTEGVRMTGVYTHFSDADSGAEGEVYSELQFRRFLAMTEGLQGVTRHCANSAAALRHPDWALDMVREGISLYGCPPVETGLDLRPCMRWEAKVSYVKEVPAGQFISYGRTWQTTRPTRIATVTCGYGDGYHRAASGRAEVLIRGKRAKVVGRICMDQMMADVTEIPGVMPEDPVTLMGRDGGEEITAGEMAAWSGTISYEVLLSAGARVERIVSGEDGESISPSP